MTAQPATVYPTVALRLTAAHHDLNEFLDLGELTHEVTPEKLWESLQGIPQPTKEDCEGHDICYLVDQIVDEQGSTGDSVEVTPEQAEQLIGRPIAEAVAAGRESLATIYGWLGVPERAAEVRGT